MNLMHKRICGSAEWAESFERDVLPWVLEDVDLGEDVLEVGPGFGATTRALAKRPGRVTALEVDEGYVDGLRAEFGAARQVEIVHGDGTAMPFPDDRFSGAVCFTMLHHVPSPALQDRLFAEVARVLAPGATFAGCDSRTSLRMRVLHLGDTLVPLDPDTLGARLERAGFADVKVAATERRLRFRAVRPLPGPNGR